MSNHTNTIIDADRSVHLTLATWRYVHDNEVGPRTGARGGRDYDVGGFVGGEACGGEIGGYVYVGG